MSYEHLKAFLLKAEHDQSIRDLLSESGADPIEIAKQYGYDISANDLVRAGAWESVGFPLNSSDI